MPGARCWRTDQRAEAFPIPSRESWISEVPAVGSSPTAVPTTVSATTVVEVPTTAPGLEDISIAREFPGVIPPELTMTLPDRETEL